jgi:hypothetical protein
MIDFYFLNNFIFYVNHGTDKLYEGLKLSFPMNPYKTGWKESYYKYNTHTVLTQNVLILEKYEFRYVGILLVRLLNS